jgi:deoxyribose-phosphate aldolase
MRIAIGADHGGFELKEHLKRWLASKGHEIDDCGAFDKSPVDYPVIAEAVARMVSRGEARRGIVVDGAGIGSSMAANKVPGVRAALCYDLSSAKNSREHNDANVLTLGARLIGEGLAEQIAELFLATECSEDRHKRRVAMIGEIEARERTAGASCAPCAAKAAAAPASSAAKGLADGPASRDSAAADGKSLAFRASASQRLVPRGSVPSQRPAPRAAAAPPPTSPPPPDPPMTGPSLDLERLSADDLARVADRIAQMLGAMEQRGDMVCFGDVCMSAAVAKQWIGFGVGRLSSTLGSWSGQGSLAEIARYIDHTLLRPDASAKQIHELCAEAREHSFMSVCVNPHWVKRCAELLRGSTVKVCTVIGFPLGANVSDVKAMEARRAIRDGAQEIDMVINVGALKSGDDDTVFRDIRAVVDAAEDGRALCKVIIETALLGDEEKVRACVLAKKARADFVKTSTGFASGGATASDVALMHRAVGGELGVKASGGVKSFADFEQMVQAGATRVGASAGIRILKEAAGETTRSAGGEGKY